MHINYNIENKSKNSLKEKVKQLKINKFPKNWIFKSYFLAKKNISYTFSIINIIVSRFIQKRHSCLTNDLMPLNTSNVKFDIYSPIYYLKLMYIRSIHRSISRSMSNVIGQRVSSSSTALEGAVGLSSSRRTGFDPSEPIYTDPSLFEVARCSSPKPVLDDNFHLMWRSNLVKHSPSQNVNLALVQHSRLENRENRDVNGFFLL